MLDSVIDDYGDLMTDLGWDDWEIASMEEIGHRTTSNKNDDGTEGGYMSPVIQPISDLGATILSSLVREDDDGERRINAPSDMDHNEIAIKGSTVATPEAAPRAVVQFTIIFDQPEQQRRWYDFIRWLRTQPAYDGETTAGKLMSFIDSHSEI